MLLGSRTFKQLNLLGIVVYTFKPRMVSLKMLTDGSLLSLRSVWSTLISRRSRMIQ